MRWDKDSCNIPIILFAGDILRKARDRRKLERLLEATSKFGDEKDLNLNPSKSAVIIHSQHGVGGSGESGNLKIEV